MAVETYIVLGKYTEQGIRAIKESPKRLRETRDAIERAGGKWIGWYLTMGRYDFVVIAQSPDAEAVATIMLSVSALGNVRTETLRGFPADEFEAIVNDML